MTLSVGHTERSQSTCNTSHKFWDQSPFPQLLMLFASIWDSFVVQASVLLLFQYAATLSKEEELDFLWNYLKIDFSRRLWMIFMFWMGSLSSINRFMMPCCLTDKVQEYTLPIQEKYYSMFLKISYLSHLCMRWGKMIRKNISKKLKRILIYLVTTIYINAYALFIECYLWGWNPIPETRHLGLI